MAPSTATRPAVTLAASRVLVAEDDESLRRLIGMQLARLGVEATLVADGQAAVDAAATGGFDAVLLDLRMPVMGGIDAALAIRADDPYLPILALTADTASEDVERCRAAGMDGHLAKPVSLPALRAELDRRIAPVLDEALLDELAENLGGRAIVDQMLVVYRRGLADRLAALRAATDPDALRDAAHALRSPSAGFGIARLAARLRRVETVARAGRMAHLGAALLAATQADGALAERLVSGRGVERRQPAPQQQREVHRGGRVGQHRVVVAAAGEHLHAAEALPAEGGAVGADALGRLDHGQRLPGRGVAAGQRVVAQEPAGVVEVLAAQHLGRRALAQDAGAHRGHGARGRAPRRRCRRTGPGRRAAGGRGARR